jgi:hypothetical protein
MERLITLSIVFGEVKSRAQWLVKKFLPDGLSCILLVATFPLVLTYSFDRFRWNAAFWP